MGTFLRYAFYLALIVIIYLVVRGIYDGQITQASTVGEVMDNVGTGVKDMAKDANSAIQKEIEK